MSFLHGWRRRTGGSAGKRAGSASPIGLWAGSSGLQLLQLERTPDSLAIRAARSLTWPDTREAMLSDPPRFAEFVAAGLRSRPFRGRRAVSALAAPEVKLMVLSYPVDDPRSESEILLRLVAERVDEPLDRLVVDYQPIRGLSDSGDERAAIVAVARRERVLAHLECFRRAGLEIDALEIPPTAMRRMILQLTGADPLENCIALFSECDRSHLVVLWGRRLILYREIEFSERNLIADVAKALELESADAEALLCRFGVHPPAPGEERIEAAAGSDEIARTLMEIAKPAFYSLVEHIDRSVIYTASKARGAAPNCVYVAGGAMRFPRAAQFLEELASLSVRRLALRDAFSFDSRAAQPPDFEIEGEMALAVGLALRGAVADG
jgi:Tfp pilus assembly PilM family ATPase